MKIKMKTILAFLTLVLIIFSISAQINMINGSEPAQEDIKSRTSNLKQAGFWNNFTFIHITSSNWTTANQSEWCSGSGTWGDPYLIENMIINASDSPVGSGIFIENSVNVYFTIKNVTIFETTNGIKLEDTNKGTLIDNKLSNNIENGIYMNNCVNNTISRNLLINNGMNGINLTSNCLNNKIIGNTAKNDGTTLQDAGIYLVDFCNDNEIKENLIYDNNVYGINIEDSCEGNLIYNNTLKNVVANLQDYLKILIIMGYTWLLPMKLQYRITK
jgi:parallel beta-helix repeat protein